MATMIAKGARHDVPSSGLAHTSAHEPSADSGPNTKPQVKDLGLWCARGELNSTHLGVHRVLRTRSQSAAHLMSPSDGHLIRSELQERGYHHKYQEAAVRISSAT